MNKPESESIYARVIRLNVRRYQRIQLAVALLDKVQSGMTKKQRELYLELRKRLVTPSP